MTKRSLRGKPKGNRGRKANQIEPKVPMVLLSDGHTEISYLKQLVAYHGPLNRNVLINDKHTGVDALSLVRIAQNIKKGKYQQNSNFSIISDDIWVVCDVEVEPETTNSRKIHDAIQMADANKIRLVLSSPCIEVWFLLHLQNGVGPLLNGDEAKRNVKNHIDDYCETNINYVENLMPFENNAIIKACNLMNSSTRMCNPATEVHVLVQKLLELKKTNGCL